MSTGAVPIFSSEEFTRFRGLVESQTPRILRHYLEYGKRVRSGHGLAELLQWLGRILLDDGQVYTLEDRARAFEIAVCERLADQWTELQVVSSGPVLVFGTVDKTALYRHILSAANSWERRAAFAQTLASRYRKNWEWICERFASRGVGNGPEDGAGQERLLDQFLARLDDLEPLAIEGAGWDRQQLRRELEQRQAQTRQQEEELGRLQSDLEFAEDRANRAHRRLKEQETELQQLRKQWQESQGNGEKLRLERSRRIKLDRQSAEATRELERLRQEYVKLDRRLQQMAQRLAAAEQQRLADQTRLVSQIDLSALRQLDPRQVLGVDETVGVEELSQVRRRFAAAFHSDRVNQLPPWVGKLFDEVLGVVNEACDQVEK